MKENQYVIISKTTLLKRIEELEEEYKSESAYQFNSYGDKLIKEIMILKQILFQSTPLIPILEQAYFEGECYGIGTDACINKQDYIKNLKLDI